MMTWTSWLYLITAWGSSAAAIALGFYVFVRHPALLNVRMCFQGGAHGISGAIKLTLLLTLAASFAYAFSVVQWFSSMSSMNAAVISAPLSFSITHLLVKGAFIGFHISALRILKGEPHVILG